MKRRNGEMRRRKKSKVEDEGRRERSQGCEEEPGREKNDCFHDYNGERKRKRGDEAKGGAGWVGKGVWGAIS